MKKEECKQLGLRVLSTAALMSIVTSIAASAFAGTYYLGNDSTDLKITANSDGTVTVEHGVQTYTDTDDEIIIKGCAGTDTSTNATAGSAETTSIGESYPTAPETKDAETEEPAAEQLEQNAEEDASEDAETSAEKDLEAPSDAGEPAPEQDENEKEPEAAAEETPAKDDTEKEKPAAAEDAEAPAEKDAEEPAEIQQAAADSNAVQTADETPVETDKTISIKNDFKKNLKIILDNIFVKSKTDSPLTVSGTKDTTIELKGDNVLDASDADGKAGLNKKNEDGTLTITTKEGESGSLTAMGGKYGAGIGGSKDESTKNITISGDDTKITADGGYLAADIGGGGTDKDTAGGNLEGLKITGGEVDLKSEYDEVGIGGGEGERKYGSDRYGNGKLGDAGMAENPLEFTGGQIKSSEGNIKGSYVHVDFSGDAEYEGGSITGDTGSITARENAKFNLSDYLGYDGIDLTLKDNASVHDLTPSHYGLYIWGKNITMQDNAKIDHCRYFKATDSIKLKGNATIEEFQPSDSLVAVGINAPEVIIEGGEKGEKVTIRFVNSITNRQDEKTPLIGGWEEIYADDGETVTEVKIGNASISGNVDIELVLGTEYQVGYYHDGDNTVAKGDPEFIFITDNGEEMTAEELMKTLGSESKITYRYWTKNEQGKKEEKLYQIVHGDGVCQFDESNLDVVKEPTCTEDGYAEAPCIYEHNEGTEVVSCNRTKKVILPAHHKEVLVGVKEATCTEDGYTGDVVCSECSETLKKGEVIPATGHDYRDDWEVTRSATGSMPGEETRHCHNNPEHTETREIPATGEDDTASVMELEVVVPENKTQQLRFNVQQNSGVRTYTSWYDNATLTGTLETLQYLKDQGAETIEFVTNGRTSRFAIDDLLALCGEGDVFYLCHTGAEEPTLLIITNDHTDLLS